MKKMWIIAVEDTAADELFLAKFSGTKEQVVKKLSEMMREDQENDDTLYNVDEPDDKARDIYGCNMFLDYHINYTAKALDDIKEA